MDAEQTVNSGQVFLWDRLGQAWCGVNGQDVMAAVSGRPALQSLCGGHGSFFRQADRIGRILTEISRDPVAAGAVRAYPGLRLLRQDPFQCYVSFIASSNSSIPNIRRSLQKVCAKFGSRASYMGKEFSLFPEPSRLARASLAQLRACGLGYRAEFVKRAAQAASSGRIDLWSLRRAPYGTAKAALLGVPGIGDKVADCIMLFSLDKLEAFPLDRWMLRILEERYPKRFGIRAGAALSPKRYEQVHEEVACHFGRYAGYAQQFLFKAGREDAGGKWA